MPQTPSIFVIQCRDELASFRAAMVEIDMPVVDMPKMMKIIFEALARDEWIPGQIGEKTIIGIVTYLFEQLDAMDIQNQGPGGRVYLEILKLAGAIKNKLRAHNAYGSGEFPYEFKEFINDDTFYLKRRDPL